MKSYETQDIQPAAAAPARGRTGFIWRCHRCGRYLGTIQRVDGTIEIYHKCGALNRLSGTLCDCEGVDTHDEPE